MRASARKGKTQDQCVFNSKYNQDWDKTILMFSYNMIIMFVVEDGLIFQLAKQILHQIWLHISSKQIKI